MANSNPDKSDIEAVFNRLRTIPTNKVSNSTIIKRIRFKSNVGYH